MAEPVGGPESQFRLTFNIETLRMLAYGALVFMVATGVVVTRLFVHEDPTHTRIFEIFGFNHICNVFDHQPSRTISGLLVLLFIMPMGAFVLCSYCRTYAAVHAGLAPRWLQTYSTIITPLVFVAVCYTYMWFVNSPDDPNWFAIGARYGNFVPHYLPYVALQLSLGLLAIHEVGYLISVGALPFGASVTAARAYLGLLLVTTVACQIAVFSLLFGRPILDSVNDPTERLIFQFLMYFYSFQAIVMPLVFAARNRRNGRTSTIVFG
jgi:uncharacterized membrane protein YhdT